MDMNSTGINFGWNQDIPIEDNSLNKSQALSTNDSDNTLISTVDWYIILPEDFANQIVGYTNSSFMIDRKTQDIYGDYVIGVSALQQFPELFLDKDFDVIELGDDEFT